MNRALPPIVTPLATIAIIAATLYTYFEVSLLESKAGATCRIQCQQVQAALGATSGMLVIVLLGIALFGAAIIFLIWISRTKKPLS